MDAERGTAHRARRDYSPGSRLLAVEEGPEKGQQLVAEVVPFEREADVRLEVAGDFAGVVVVAFELEGEDLSVLDRAPDRVRELDLPACPGRGGVKSAEDVVGEDVAADDGEVGGCVAHRRLLDQVGDLMDAARARAGG